MVSDRATATTPFAAMDVLERASEREDAIHLEVGEPDFAPPESAVDTAVASLRSGDTGYTTSRGKIELRAAIAAYYDERYGVDVGVDRIVVTPGSSPALLLAFLALCDPGDEVVLTDPHYACYPNFVRQAGGRVTTVPLRPDDGFTPDVAAMGRALERRPRALLLNSPANPTGAVLPGETLGELVDLASRAGTRVVADEVYHGLSYDEPARSALEYTDDAFVIDGFSKRFAMTGWRLGWIVCPPDYADVVNRLAQNVVICAPHFVQDAGVAALESAADYVPRMRETYRERRDYVVDAVEDLGLGLGYVPGGAYYLLVDVSDLGGQFGVHGTRGAPNGSAGTRNVSARVADALLDRAGIAMTPGPDFGELAAPYLRLSYATGIDALEEAMARLERVLETTTP